MRLLSITEKLPSGQSVQCCSMENGEKIDDYDLFRQKRSSILVRRCKSVNGTCETTSQAHRGVLKTKSSPTSPKKVHFADSNGHELVEVKKYCAAAEELAGWYIPRQVVRPRSFTVPRTVSLPKSEQRLVLPCFSLRPRFDLPQLDDINDLVDRNSICLENVVSEARWLTIICRVQNYAFSKEVSVRFTFNKWLSFTETHAKHTSHAEDGCTDRFEMRVHVPKRVRELEFALRYQVGGKEFWDNNQAQNYRVEAHS